MNNMSYSKWIKGLADEPPMNIVSSAKSNKKYWIVLNEYFVAVGASRSKLTAIRIALNTFKGTIKCIDKLYSIDEIRRNE